MGRFINPPGIEIDPSTGDIEGIYYIVRELEYPLYKQFAIGKIDNDNFYAYLFLSDIIADSEIARETYESY